MSPQIEEFQGAPEDWDKFAKSRNGWTHFHLYKWKNVIESTFGHECLYLAKRTSDGSIAGLLPLVRVRSRIFGHYLVSMPFVNYGGPLGTPDSIERLAEYASQVTRASGADLLELRSRADLGLSLPVSHRKVTVLLDLPTGDPDLLWKLFRAKLRSQIKKPQKEGVTVRFGLDQVADFHKVYARHMRDLGTPAQPRKLFDAIANAFPESVWYGCAYLGDAVIAAGCGFQWGGEIEITWAASLREYNRIAPNMLLYWGFMERAINNGLSVFNFGRCTPGGSTHRFKQQWGSRDQPLWWYQQQSGTTSTPSPDDSRYSWGPRIWRRLPLPVANLLGPRIVRYIP